VGVRDHEKLGILGMLEEITERSFSPRFRAERAEEAESAEPHCL
jgi:hypothetical protein